MAQRPYIDTCSKCGTRHLFTIGTDVHYLFESDSKYDHVMTRCPKCKTYTRLFGIPYDTGLPIKRYAKPTKAVVESWWVAEVMDQQRQDHFFEWERELLK